MLTFTITSMDHCRQLDGFLHRILPFASPSYLRKIVSSGHVSVNNQKVDGTTLLCLDDVVSMKESARTKALLVANQSELEILYEDTWIVIFNKAPGLAMHRAAEVDENNLVDLGSKMLNRRDGGNNKLRPVNRLDRGTSGAVILAKSATAAGMFGRQLKEEGLDKLYLAIVEGEMDGDGTIAIPLDGKDAETRYQTIFKGHGRTLVAAYPITGRMHQLRLHFQAAGHPICGDGRYGGCTFPGHRGHTLHSFRSSITHPATGERTTVFAPLPDEFLTVLKRISGDQYLTVFKKLPDLC